MIGQYSPNYLYNEISVRLNAPDSWGVYYCGTLNPNGSLFPYYVGRASDQNVTVKSRLLDHIRVGEWPDITHFVFVTCSTSQEAEQFEMTEIARLNNPKYNKRLG